MESAGENADLEEVEVVGEEEVFARCAVSVDYTVRLVGGVHFGRSRGPEEGLGPGTGRVGQSRVKR